jgi:hypothetical protein
VSATEAIFQDASFTRRCVFLFLSLLQCHIVPISYLRAVRRKMVSNCVCFKGWMRVYYGLDLLLSKLSKAQSNGKFRERHRSHISRCLFYTEVCVPFPLLIAMSYCAHLLSACCAEENGVLLCLFQGLDAGLLRPRPSLK